MNTDWTDARIAILVDEHAKGTRRRYIAQIINSQTGSAFSKSAVCGKIDRLFPAARPVKTEAEKAATKARQRERDRLKKQRKRSCAEFSTERKIKRKYESIRIVAANGNSKAMRVIRTVTTDQATLRCVEVDPRHLSFAELGPKDCRYPYGDGPFTFCGRPQLDGYSYCEGHKFLCWVPPRVLTDKAPQREAA